MPVWLTVIVFEFPICSIITLVSAVVLLTKVVTLAMLLLSALNDAELPPQHSVGAGAGAGAGAGLFAAVVAAAVGEAGELVGAVVVDELLAAAGAAGELAGEAVDVLLFVITLLTTGSATTAT